MSTFINSLKWVTPIKLSELTGYTVKAIQNKIDSGVWRYGKIWIKGPDNRRLINTEEYERWAESQLKSR